MNFVEVEGVIYPLSAVLDPKPIPSNISEGLQDVYRDDGVRPLGKDEVRVFGTFACWWYTTGWTIDKILQAITDNGEETR